MSQFRSASKRSLRKARSWRSEPSLVPLEKFCNKKLLQIEYVTPANPQDANLLSQVIKLGKEYERISGVHFVTHEDVLDLIRRLTDPTRNVLLPNFIKEHAKLFLDELSLLLEPDTGPDLHKLALITKIKMVESMYAVYSTDVTHLQRRQKLHQQLEELIIDTKSTQKGKKGKKGKSDKSSKSSKKSKDKKGNKNKEESSSTLFPKSKEPSTISITDYTEITLSENEVIFDYNIDNHVQYVVLSGFPDPELFKELSKLHITPACVIQFSSSPSATQMDHLIASLQTPLFQNTALMKFHAEPAPLKTILEQLVHVVQKINHIKRQHLHYTKNLTFFDLGPEPKNLLPAKCLRKYSRLLNAYPPQLVNVAVIMDALLEEICWRELGPIYSLSDLSTDSSQTELPSVKETETSPYQVHEEDALNMALHSFKEIGRKYYDTNLHYLKLLKPFERRETLTLLKDRATSTEDQCYCSSLENFTDAIHLAIFSQMKPSIFEPSQPEEYDFTRNLVTYNEALEYCLVQPEILGTVGEQRPTKEKNDVIHNYHLKEDLSTSVLGQLVLKALMQYSRYQGYYCEESGAVLLRFHDNLDEFGLSTRLWNEHLPTAVCLRDFCRFTSTEARPWLEENMLPRHRELNADQEEECRGLKDIQIEQVYEEYQHLLGTPQGTSKEKKKAVFKEVLRELQSYPDSNQLETVCAKTHTPSAFTVYNIQPSRVQITGHTTIFSSCDGVKATVDTCRFLTQSRRCSIEVAVDDNHLIFHSMDATAFHFFLADGTLVRFRECEAGEEVAKPVSKGELISVQSAEEEDVPVADTSFYDNYWVQVLRKYKIPNTVPNFYDKVSVSQRKLHLTGKNLDTLLESLKMAIYKGYPTYKISTRKSVSLLERKMSPVQFPLTKILKRVMFKPVSKKRKIKGYNLIHYSENRRRTLNYDFQVTLPHGLVISTLTRNRQVTEVKQTNQYIELGEEYRIFYATGTVLVKNSDGSCSIYRSNGDMVRLSDERKNDSKCSEKMRQLFAKLETEVCPYTLTRCESAEETRSDFKGILDFASIPYAVVTLVEFEGKKTVVADGKVTETQAVYILSENDYHSEEVFFKREDNFRCLINKKGERIMHFPDGTKITAFAKMERELVFVSKNPKAEGWVSIVISYKFEHLNYTPVVYNALENSTQIFLKDAVMKIHRECVLLTTEKNVALEVTCQSIILLKTCPLCDSDCICKINPKAKPEDKLLEVCDSYNKYFACDREGNCVIHADYIRGAKNRNKCDHQSKHEDTKMFVLNRRSPPGSLLWRDSAVEEKMALKAVKVVNYMNRLTNKQTIEIFTDVYQEFSERFTMSHLYRNRICLSKYRHEEEKESKVVYVTYRILNEFQELKDNPDSLQEFAVFIGANEELFSPQVLDAISCMFKSIEVDDTKSDICSYRISMQEMRFTEDNESVDIGTDIDKVTVAEVIDTWRKACEQGKNLIKSMTYPGYFYSDYYKYVLSELQKNTAQHSAKTIN